MTSKPLITLFTTPKPFANKDDHTTIIQTNAIRSWARLGPLVQVILIGDEPGIEAMAKQLGVQHSSQLQYNARRTPLVSSAFETARSMSDAPLLAYCNSDVILTENFLTTIKRLMEIK